MLTVQRCDSSKVFPSDNQHNLRSEGKVVLLTVQRCDSSKVFPSDNQHDRDAAFPQERVAGVEKVDPKNAHLALSHEYLSLAVRSQQVRN
ncbi:unnamed protein product [Schistosoma margrebowiei]|uniref:Uncharacterized protein n=1 Tax=Schistosoma margrebowiei TaxID=48269 RepID=A0A3P8D335_9TREM|nr:unnamed protein product [Schistosoma margrebowiei]